MSLQWTETLRGSYFLVDSPDNVRPCEVRIHIVLHRPRGLERQIDAQMTGDCTFDGLSEQAPIDGLLRVQIARPRRVSYSFEFKDKNAEALRFQGAKHPSLLRPLYSATTLWGSLFRGDRAIAMVALHFDLRRDLVAFVQSVIREADAAG